MDIYFRIDNNILTAILLGSIIIIAYNRLDKGDMLNRAYIRVSIVVIMQLLLEAATVIVDGRQGKGAILISYLLNISIFLIAPLLSYSGYLLIRSIVLPNKIIPIKSKILLQIPVVIISLFILFTFKYHLLFYIDESNIYHRGPYFFLFNIIIYFYIVLCLLLVIRKRKLLTMQEIIPFIMLFVFSAIGGIVQSMFYGMLLAWSSLGLSLVIVYAFLQQRMVLLDDLTGAWTRGSFDNYINSRMKHRKNEKLGVVFCDIDDLKHINDKHGHMEGDRAIKTVIKIIKNTIHKNDIIARLGGDEFIIIIDTNQSDVLRKTLKRIENAFQNYNNNLGLKYKLDCSFGADMLDLSECEIKEFISHIDSTMYENKRKKKLAR